MATPEIPEDVAIGIYHNAVMSQVTRVVTMTDADKPWESEEQKMQAFADLTAEMVRAAATQAYAEGFRAGIASVSDG